jgi:hypothetical protein
MVKRRGIVASLDWGASHETDRMHNRCLRCPCRQRDHLWRSSQATSPSRGGCSIPNSSGDTNDRPFPEGRPARLRPCRCQGRTAARMRVSFQSPREIVPLRLDRSLRDLSLTGASAATFGVGQRLRRHHGDTCLFVILGEAEDPVITTPRKRVLLQFCADRLLDDAACAGHDGGRAWAHRLILKILVRLFEFEVPKRMCRSIIGTSNSPH